MLAIIPQDMSTMPDNVVPLSAAKAQSETERRTETTLLISVRDHGDRDAFSQLFDIFTPRLRAYARKQGADPQLAENVVQDVMVTAWTRARLFNPDKASARTWIYTLVRNRLIDQHRSAERQRRAYANLALDTPEIGHDTNDAERDLTGSRVTALLQQLPDEQAQAILMTYVEGKSHREIAEELDVPTGTIKSRTRLALQRLRKLMELTS